MSSELLSTMPPPPATAPRTAPRRVKSRTVSAHTTLSAHGAPCVWLTGGALATALIMIVGLLVLVTYEGLRTFWPQPVVLLQVDDGSGGQATFLGEVTRSEGFRPGAEVLAQWKERSPELFARANAAMGTANGWLRRRLIWTGRSGALDFAGSRAAWIDDFAIASETRPQWAVVFERRDGGRSYGTPSAFSVDGKAVADTPQTVWDKYAEYHHQVVSRWRRSVSLERHERGAVDRRQRAARLALVDAELQLADARGEQAADSAAIESALARVGARQQALEQTTVWAEQERTRIGDEVHKLTVENARFVLTFTSSAGEAVELPMDNIVRGYPANQLSLIGKARVYLSRWWEFLTCDPRESNTEGGVFPAIWGTVAMTIIMSLMAVPFGVLAALYLREYAKPGPIVSAVRISINNLAGVPSIVFGVFGLGLFCYGIGASIDQLFFRAAAAEGTPTYGTGGILWASLTLALLTLPVVIVATEEALAAVPNSMREGSYACGASKWQTIRRIVLPRAMPGIMTGMILAMARGAGEVAPLMLVGVRDMAPSLPVDGVFPFVHPERSFMHLAYQVYIVGFKSPNAEAAKPMVFTTTLLLIAIVAFLSIAAVNLRSRLRRRFAIAQF